jgi:hypothetical protein
MIQILLSITKIKFPIIIRIAIPFKINQLATKTAASLTEILKIAIIAFKLIKIAKNNTVLIK